MNTNHFPSLEICKKLTEIGFPETENSFIQNFDGTSILVNHSEYDYENHIAVCPSVMEMLDVIPKEFTFDIRSTYWNEQDHGTPDNPYDGELNPLYEFKIYDEDYEEISGFMYRKYYGKVPDAIASKLLWLVENNYISFTK